VRRIHRAEGAPTPIKPTCAIDCITDPFLLTAHLMDVGRSGGNQPYGPRMRVSALAEGCVRERVLGYLHKIRPKAHGKSLAVTFDIGNAFHWWLQNDPGNSYFGDRRIGFWRCMACGRKKFGPPPKKGCQKCGARRRALHYHENQLRVSEPYMAQGHVDMYLDVDHNRTVRITDFKSVSGKEFVTLTGPRGKDAIQIVGYMVLHELGATLPEPYHVDTERGFVVYISKDHAARSLPFKIFPVIRNKAWVDTVTAQIRAFTVGVVHKRIPPLLAECRQSEWGCARASYCPALLRCKESE